MLSHCDRVLKLMRWYRLHEPVVIATTGWHVCRLFLAAYHESPSVE